MLGELYIFFKLLSELVLIIVAGFMLFVLYQVCKVKYSIDNAKKTDENRRGFEPVCGAPFNTIMPVRGSDNAAGYDFYAPCDIRVPAHGKSPLIYFNVKAYMEPDEWLYMRIRSGMATKHGIMLETSGVIDADYYNNPNNDGNIATVFRNHGDQDFLILKGERCCQGIFMKYLVVENDKSLGARRGGYGSTGK